MSNPRQGAAGLGEVRCLARTSKKKHCPGGTPHVYIYSVGLETMGLPVGCKVWYGTVREWFKKQGKGYATFVECCLQFGEPDDKKSSSASGPARARTA